MEKPQSAPIDYNLLLCLRSEKPVKGTEDKNCKDWEPKED